MAGTGKIQVSELDGHQPEQSKQDESGTQIKDCLYYALLCVTIKWLFWALAGISVIGILVNGFKNAGSRYGYTCGSLLNPDRWEDQYYGLFDSYRNYTADDVNRACDAARAESLGPVIGFVILLLVDVGLAYAVGYAYAKICVDCALFIHYQGGALQRFFVDRYEEVHGTYDPKQGLLEEDVPFKLGQTAVLYLISPGSQVAIRSSQLLGQMEACTRAAMADWKGSVYLLAMLLQKDLQGNISSLIGADSVTSPQWFALVPSGSATSASSNAAHAPAPVPYPAASSALPASVPGSAVPMPDAAATAQSAAPAPTATPVPTPTPAPPVFNASAPVKRPVETPVPMPAAPVTTPAADPAPAPASTQIPAPVTTPDAASAGQPSVAGGMAPTTNQPQPQTATTPSAPDVDLDATVLSSTAHGSTSPAGVGTPAPRFCGNCGKPLDAGAKFCGHCGHPIA